MIAPLLFFPDSPSCTTYLTASGKLCRGTDRFRTHAGFHSAATFQAGGADVVAHLLFCLWQTTGRVKKTGGGFV
jgi:hypothetical protein